MSTTQKEDDMGKVKLLIPEEYRVVRDPTVTEILASNVGASIAYLSVAVARRRDGGELTEQATANLKIIRRWADMLLAGEIPQPGDGVSE